MLAAGIVLLSLDRPSEVSNIEVVDNTMGLEPHPDTAEPRSSAPPTGRTAEPTSTPPEAPATAESTVLARDVLEQLEVKGRAPATGYDREALFGQAWFDVELNGCDTRNDVLARDLLAAVIDATCLVRSGTLNDPYTGRTIQFVRGPQSALVQIDHVVALSNAWQTGAQQLTQEQRIQFANDPLNLLASDGAANQQKGAGDAATWLPPNHSFRCQYVARQVSVKAAYGLWVTPAEYDAISMILEACPAEPAVTR